MSEIRVYGAGDGPSFELRCLLAKAGYQVDFRDIRGQDGAENRAFLLKAGLQTIPQAFDSQGHPMGDFESTLRGLGLEPDQIASAARLTAP